MRDPLRSAAEFIVGLTIAVLLVYAFAGQVRADGKALDGIFMQTLAPTYQLFDGDRPMCSGTFIRSDDKEDLYLTAAHCVAASGRFNVRQRVVNDEFEVTSERVFYLKPVRTLTGMDVAVLRTAEPSGVFAVAKIADEETGKSLVPGMPVIAAGYPLAMERTLTRGEFTERVKAPDGFDMKGAVYRATANIASGSSGGGLYVETADGWRLVGCAAMVANGNPFIAVFSTLDSVRRVTDGLLEADKSALPSPKEIRAAPRFGAGE